MESTSRRAKLQEAGWKAELAAGLFTSGDKGIGSHALRDAWHAVLELKAVDAVEAEQVARILAVLDALALGRPLLAA